MRRVLIISAICLSVFAIAAEAFYALGVGDDEGGFAAIPFAIFGLTMPLSLSFVGLWVAHHSKPVSVLLKPAATIFMKILAVLNWLSAVSSLLLVSFSGVFDSLIYNQVEGLFGEEAQPISLWPSAYDVAEGIWSFFMFMALGLVMWILARNLVQDRADKADI